VAIACDAHAPTEHQRSDLASVAKKLSTMKKGGYRIAAPSQKKHQRPSYGLACSRPSHSCRKSPASRSLATALSEGALARGLLHMSRTLTIPQLNATNYPPARHRTPGDIMSEYRARSSRNARATSSESSHPAGGWLLRVGSNQVAACEAALCHCHEGWLAIRDCGPMGELERPGIRQVDQRCGYVGGIH